MNSILCLFTTLHVLIILRGNNLHYHKPKKNYYFIILQIIFLIDTIVHHCLLIYFLVCNLLYEQHITFLHHWNLFLNLYLHKVDSFYYQFLRKCFLYFFIILREGIYFCNSKSDFQIIKNIRNAPISLCQFIS